MLTQEIVREFLNYDPDTGKLTWRYRDRRWFNTNRAWNTWNSKFARKETFCSSGSHGYLQGEILNKKYVAHRVIWLWMTGEWPKEQIDHINHDRTNNKWYNLREVSKLENCKNQSTRDNVSGCMGVYFHKRTQKWQASIKNDRKRIHLGYFAILEDAIKARKRAEMRYGFHENHGTQNFA